MRLLVVEDEGDLASALADHLAAQGHAVDLAADLATAADALAGWITICCFWTCTCPTATASPSCGGCGGAVSGCRC
jgi:Response regulators consisting of a CheY-like receiver domain and a winged-helix DNA-binding domain